MTVEEQALQLKNTLESLKTDKASKEEVTALETQIKELATKADTEALKTTVDALTESINQMKEATEKKVNSGSIKEQIESTLKENESAITAFKERNASPLNMELKAAAVMLTTTHAEEDVLRQEREAGVTRQMEYKPSIWDVLRKVRTNAAVIKWVEKLPKAGEAKFIGEGKLKPQKDFIFKAHKHDIKKVAVHEKASLEMLTDIDGFREFLNEDMSTAVYDEIKEQAVVGDGTGENLTGLMKIATPFAAGTKKVKNANFFDVIRLAIAQIAIAGGNPTHFALNPIDAVDFDLEKDANGQYILPPFSTSSGMQIKGVRMVEDINIPAGEFLVWDNSKAVVKMREDVGITAGYVNDDFILNLQTFVCESRLFLLVKSTHFKAFVKGKFADAITAITPEQVGK